MPASLTESMPDSSRVDADARRQLLTVLRANPAARLVALLHRGRPPGALPPPQPEPMTTPLDLDPFFRRVFGATLLGAEVTPAVYAQVGFRFIAVPANTDRRTLERRIQEFLNNYRLSPTRALQRAIQLGYEASLGGNGVTEYVHRLRRDPQERIRLELFWPHLDPSLFAPIEQTRCLACPEAWEVLLAAQASLPPPGPSLVNHALAVILHNRALTAEAAFASGQAAWAGELWQEALDRWASVLADDRFWAYLRERAMGAGDSQVTADDIAQLRRELPEVLLGFNAQLARFYAAHQANVAAAAHVHLLRDAPFPQAARRRALAATVQAVVDSRLEPLLRRLEAEVLPGDERVSRERFEGLIRPILDGAEGVRRFLGEDLGLLPRDLAAEPPAPADAGEPAGGEPLTVQFDLIAGQIQRAVNKRIDYGTDDALRRVLYAMLITRMMLGWPLSPGKRRELLDQLKRDTEMLYKDNLAPAGFDPTQCWFLAGEPADPDASLLYQFYQVTKVAGVRVSWSRRDVLVPRSARAREVHQGRLTRYQTFRDARNAQPQRPPWTAPTPGSSPFTFIRGTEVRSLLELAEQSARLPAEALQHLLTGRISAWLDQRGQPALAGVLRQLETPATTPDALLTTLRWFALDEVDDHVAKIDRITEEEAARLQANFDAEARSERNALDAHLREHRARLTQLRAQVQKEGAQVQRQLAANLAEIDTQGQADLAAIREAAREGIAAAQAQTQTAEQENQGWRGAASLELPIAAIATVTLLGCAVVGQTAGLLPPAWPMTALSAVGMILGAVVATVLGRKTRQGRIAHAQAALAAAEGDLARQLQAREDQTRQARQSAEQQAQQAEQALKGRVQALETEGQHLQAEGEKRIQAVRTRGSAAIKTCREAGSRQTSDLRNRIERLFTFRDENQTQQFPPLRATREAGFQAGKEPSDAEVNRLVKQSIDRFLDSLSSSERELLVMVYTKLPTETGNELLAELMALSPSARSSQFMPILLRYIK